MSTDKDARILELFLEVNRLHEESNRLHLVAVTAVDKLRYETRKYDEHLEELERKLTEQQAITQQAIALMEPMQNYLPYTHVQRWVSCVHSPSAHFNAALAKAKEAGRNDVVTPRCKTCKFNVEHNCMMLSSSPDDMEAKRIFGVLVTKAYTYDADGHQSGLIVQDDFGCVEYEGKE